MENGYKSCKNCVHYRIAIFGPLNQGYCTKERYRIVYNQEKQMFEKVREEDCELDSSQNSGSCRYFKPHIPESTYKWFVDLFNNPPSEPAL